MVKLVTKFLRVSSRSEGFRRAGIAFGTVPQDLPLAGLSEAQRAAIISEPNLVSFEVDGEVEAPAQVSVSTAPPGIANSEAPSAPQKMDTTAVKAKVTEKAKPASKKVTVKKPAAKK